MRQNFLLDPELRQITLLRNCNILTNCITLEVSALSFRSLLSSPFLFFPLLPLFIPPVCFFFFSILCCVPLFARSTHAHLTSSSLCLSRSPFPLASLPLFFSMRLPFTAQYVNPDFSFSRKFSKLFFIFSNKLGLATMN